MKPSVLVLEEVPDSAWSDAETFWIQYMRFIGCRLTNASDGGRGATNLSKETRQRISQARKGIIFSAEHRKNLSLAHKCQKPSNLTQLAEMARGKRSAEHRKAISNAITLWHKRRRH